MYTPDETKRLLENHKEYTFSSDELYASALKYIKQLEHGIDRCYKRAKEASAHIKNAIRCSERIDDLSQQLEAAQPKWISVEEQKPKSGKFVLFQYAKNAQNPTLHARNTMAVGRYEYGMFLVEGCSVKVTHWMPLPEPPKEEA